MAESRILHPIDREALFEGVDREAKAAQGRDGQGHVPESVWQTYSSFCNTSGGVGVLACAEAGAAFYVIERHIRILLFSEAFYSWSVI